MLRHTQLAPLSGATPSQISAPQLRQSLPDSWVLSSISYSPGVQLLAPQSPSTIPPFSYPQASWQGLPGSWGVAISGCSSGMQKSLAGPQLTKRGLGFGFSSDGNSKNVETKNVETETCILMGFSGAARNTWKIRFMCSVDLSDQS